MNTPLPKRLLPMLATSCLTWIAAGSDVIPASHWPQWRGPLANGVAPGADPPVEWSETKNVAWKVKLPGRGTGTPIIWGDQVFLQAAIPTGRKAEPPSGAAGPAAAPSGPQGPFGVEQPGEVYQFAVLCLDRRSGKELWRTTVREEVPHEGHHRDHDFASYSAVTDGERLYSWFGSRGLHGLDFAGKVIWTRDLGRMKTRNSFGEGSSPALHGDRLFVNWDHEGDDFIMALDKRTGDTLWKRDRDEPTSWSTPLIVQHAGRVQVVVSATRKIRSYDAASGDPLWECGGLTDNVIPSPVTGHGLVYALSGFRGSALLAINPGRSGDLTGTEAIAWKHLKSTPYVPSPLLYDDFLYFLSVNSAILSCVDAKTGQVHYDAERIEGISGVYASPVGAAGRVYVVGRDGNAVVIKQGPKPEILARNKLDDKIDASPVVVGKQLFLRGHEHLYCLSTAN